MKGWWGEKQQKLLKGGFLKYKILNKLRTQIEIKKIEISLWKKLIYEKLINESIELHRLYKKEYSKINEFFANIK